MVSLLQGIKKLLWLVAAVLVQYVHEWVETRLSKAFRSDLEHAHTAHQKAQSRAILTHWQWASTRTIRRDAQRIPMEKVFNN